jgi:hypothetical protein
MKENQEKLLLVIFQHCILYIFWSDLGSGFHRKKRGYQPRGYQIVWGFLIGCWGKVSPHPHMSVFELFIPLEIPVALQIMSDHEGKWLLATKIDFYRYGFSNQSIFHKAPKIQRLFSDWIYFHFVKMMVSSAKWWETAGQWWTVCALF